MKTTVKFIIAAAASLALLTACGKSPAENVGEPSIPDDYLVSTENNTPDNIVEQHDSAATTAPESSSAEDNTEQTADSTESTEPTEPDTKADPDDSSDNTDAEQKESLPDTEAMKYLKILNSKHVHAKLMHLYSFDGDELMSIEREYFIDGDEKIYINDGNKTFIRGGNMTYVDYDSEIYYTAPNDMESDSEFGFSLDSYVLISQEPTEDGISELYNVDSERIASTWEFLTDGTVKVSDRSLDTPAFDCYIFEIIEDGGFEMDFTIPESFTEVDSELYTFE